MNTFFKTFFICLILTLGFLAYKYVASDSYSNELVVSKENNPIFGVHREVEYKDNIDKNTQTQIEQTDNKQEVKSDAPQKRPEKYTYTCYFYSASGELVPLKRELSAKMSLENTISLLLKGPTIAETKKGIYSEIPSNVDLISLKRTGNSIIVNLSSNFGNGGGSQSVENRVKQLSKTIKSYASDKDIYLYINSKEVEYLGGDGVYIKQPLE